MYDSIAYCLFECRFCFQNAMPSFSECIVYITYYMFYLDSWKVMISIHFHLSKAQCVEPTVEFNQKHGPVLYLGETKSL